MFSFEMWQSVKFKNISVDSHFLFVGLVSHCSCGGLLPNNDQYLKTIVFSDKDISLEQFQAYKMELFNGGLIDFTIIKFQDYIIINDFDSFLEAPKVTESRFPTSLLFKFKQWDSMAKRYKLKEAPRNNKAISLLLDRMKEHEFKFDEILNCIQLEPYYRGKNKENKKITFDFIIENSDNYKKILKGSFIPKTETPGRTNKRFGTVTDYSESIRNKWNSFIKANNLEIKQLNSIDAETLAYIDDSFKDANFDFDLILANLLKPKFQSKNYSFKQLFLSKVYSEILRGA